MEFPKRLVTQVLVRIDTYRVDFGGATSTHRERTVIWRGAGYTTQRLTALCDPWKPAPKFPLGKVFRLTSEFVAYRALLGFLPIGRVEVIVYDSDLNRRPGSS